MMSLTPAASQSRKDRQETVQPDTAEKKYVVRHNKTTRELTLEELTSAAEKGLDYERIRPSHEYVKGLAARNGETDVARFLAQQAGAGENADAGNRLAAEKAAPTPDDEFRAENNVPDAENEVLHKEYPRYFEKGVLPEEVSRMMDGGMKPLEACRLYDLHKTKAQCEELRARLAAQQANRENSDASLGALAGGDAAQKDFYTSREWDTLAPRQKEALIRSGKIYEFMKKWSKDV